ncbi:MAG: hypothetical protein M1449_00580 [Candidatus Thermoplasmatota archaeon]|nr:hypothetical protein [Candidatus Thermoplasmatota archaeon]
MKTVTLDIRSPSDAMTDFVQAWKTGKPQRLQKPFSSGHLKLGDSKSHNTVFKWDVMRRIQ